MENITFKIKTLKLHKFALHFEMCYIHAYSTKQQFYQDFGFVTLLRSQLINVILLCVVLLTYFHNILFSRIYEACCNVHSWSCHLVNWGWLQQQFHGVLIIFIKLNVCWLRFVKY